MLLAQKPKSTASILVVKPYITKAYFGKKNPPVKLAKIAIGDGSLGSDIVNEILPTVRSSTLAGLTRL